MDATYAILGASVSMSSSGQSDEMVLPPVSRRSKHLGVKLQLHDGAQGTQVRTPAF